MSVNSNQAKNKFELFRILPKFLFIVLILLSLVSCGTPMPKSYSLGDAYSPEPNQEGKAAVYIFYRQAHVQAPCFVQENGIKIGVIKAGTYFIRHVSPGEYEYLATNDSSFKSPIRIKAESGKEYYIEVIQETDFLSAHAYMSVAGKEQAEAILPTLNKITYTP